jgi:putative ABC transport system permease protein
MMILVIANSFAHGMVDVLINDVVATAFGHLVVQGQQGNNSYQIIRDRERIIRVLNENIKQTDMGYIIETMTAMARAVGNGESDNVVIVGSIPFDEKNEVAFCKKTYFSGLLNLVAGNFDDFFNDKIEYPVIISESKAKSLKVKVHDVIRVRVQMITGQIEAANFTVIAIANTNNTYMDIVTLMEGKRLKKLLGYKPWEAFGRVKISLKNPLQTANHYASVIYPKLQPQLLSIVGNIAAQECQALAFKNDDGSKEVLASKIRIIQGSKAKAFTKDGVMVSSRLAQKLNLHAGSEFIFQYPTKFRGLYQEKFQLAAIYQTGTKLGDNIILVNEERIHDIFNRYLPKTSDWSYIAKTDPLYPVMATEWKLLPRAKDEDSLMKLYNDERQIKTDQEKINVVTMYEGASGILKMEGVLNLLTIIAVLVLLFIILIGVVNTLRMTVKERTREIGTVRAIGMQKRDIRNEFMLETLLLTAISCVVGIVAGIIVMQILGAIPFNVNNNLSMILRNKHMVFQFDFVNIIAYSIFIVIITGVTAYFPARRAANLSAVEALRHYE